ncbi:MAG: Hsp20/alpha crystallin family protein [Candidatus Melainabacteria bacterium]|nr:Hsp20/alpha crystallin family protein [Candidatus Melainabacteria bacterium]
MDFKLLPSKWLNKKNGLAVRKEDSNELSDHKDEHPVYSLQSEVNRLFDDFFRATDMPMLRPSFALSPFSTLEQGSITPRIDVRETDKELRISAELPGLSENEIDVSLSRDVLTISGEKKKECEQNVQGWYRMERSYGTFTRSIPLPVEVDQDSCNASFKNGVLTVSFAKTAQAQANTKSIPIKKE